VSCNLGELKSYIAVELASDYLPASPSSEESARALYRCGVSFLDSLSCLTYNVAFCVLPQARVSRVWRTSFAKCDL
jgi:hypothetical protein